MGHETGYADTKEHENTAQDMTQHNKQNDLIRRFPLRVSATRRDTKVLRPHEMTRKSKEIRGYVNQRKTA